MKAVVMAGGEGTRLRPLTCYHPKPMVPVVNRPVVEHIIELLRNHGITEIILTLHYLAEEVVTYLGDGSDFGVSITYSVEDEPLGTAGSVKQVEHLLTEPFLIISGDALTDLNLSEIVAFHQSNRAIATLTLVRVENPLEFGVVIVDEEGKVRRFLEKPGWGEVFSDTVNTGIYVIDPAVFKLMQTNKVYDWSKDIFPVLLAKSERLFGYVANGYWCDIGNLQQYRQAQYDVLEGKVKTSVLGHRVRKDVWVGEGTEIDPRSEIQGRVVIGKNCRIKARAVINELSVIGDNCIIEEGALVNRSVLWNNTYIGRRSKLSGCCVCRSTTIKGNAIISEGVVIGDQCFIGQGALVHSQVKVWPEKRIEAGATVNMSLIWGAKWPGSLFGVQGISGVANIEITPEFAMKLGAAYGASLDKSAVVITSRDMHRSSRMINRSIICGLISVGVNVLDYRAMPTPVSRYAIAKSQAQGGVHVKLSPRDPRSLLVEFIDSHGVNIDKFTERKIENIFFREDFRRTTMEEVGAIDFPSRAIDHYMEGYFNLIDAQLIKKTSFKVVMDYAYGTSSLVLPLLLGRLGCDTVTLNAYLDAERGKQVRLEKGKALTQLSHIVTTLSADFGLWVDVDGEKFVLIDEYGRIISGFQLLCLVTAMFMSVNPGAVIAAPLNAPLALSNLVKQHGGKLIYSKADPRSLMVSVLSNKEVGFAGDKEGGFIFSQFLPAFDAMFAFGKLMEIMAKSKMTISQFLEEVPPFYLASQSMECTWQDKGRIMREIIEDAGENRIELIDGVKIYPDDKSWELVLSDPAEPLLHLHAEGETHERAQSLVEEFKQRIERLRSKESLMVEKDEGKPPRPFPELETYSELLKEQEEGDDKDERITVPPERSFYFWKNNHFLGACASNLSEFAAVLEYLDPQSLVYHISRGDFQRWFTNVLGEEDLAHDLDRLASLGKEGEELRSLVLEAITDRLESN